MTNLFQNESQSLKQFHLSLFTQIKLSIFMIEMNIRKPLKLDQLPIPQSKHIIIDCDVGGDDALCIVLASYLSKKFGKQIVAIFCVEGNTAIQNVVTNAVISTKIAGLKTPIYKGAWITLLGNQIGNFGDGYFSNDGIGGKQKKYKKMLTEEDNKNILRKKCCSALQQLTKKYQGDLSILALGPLTNLAMAYLYDNNIVNRINSVSIMGGSYSAVGRHQHFSADFNFFLDPESAKVVLRNYKNIILTTIEYTSDFRLQQPSLVFQNRMTLKSSFIADIYQPIVQRTSNPVLCDPLASFPLFCPKQCQIEVYKVHGTVVLHGLRTRGMLSLDWLGQGKAACNFMQPHIIVENQLYIVASMNKNVIEQMVRQSLIG